MIMACSCFCCCCCCSCLRCCLQGTFSVLYIYSPELYPTVVRAFGLALCNLCSRLGGFLSPYVTVQMVESGHAVAGECLLAGACWLLILLLLLLLLWGVALMVRLPCGSQRVLTAAPRLPSVPLPAAELLLAAVCLSATVAAFHLPYETKGRDLQCVELATEDAPSAGVDAGGAASSPDVWTGAQGGVAAGGGPAAAGPGGEAGDQQPLLGPQAAVAAAAAAAGGSMRGRRHPMQAH